MESAQCKDVLSMAAMDAHDAHLLTLSRMVDAQSRTVLNPRMANVWFAQVSIVSRVENVWNLYLLPAALALMDSLLAKMENVIAL